ncbi:TetR/AcrR family transcriptional regulator [Glaciihabitans arcticus]|uniref:TetR/AcrR family transcriptional regulator n=1 Tax=Glaciihabitans arcticus TaxID=2668039 RepID=A0A4Q9GRJ1_9MICO|nr:TetR/AcrR family transcriptional regulator [Glaciihabitans arcticus]TBN57185.1 TetR/AcrR family transcriptional regulator [Glaciihabitans arcticus]
MTNPVARKPQRPREGTIRRREDIIKAGLATFGSKGFKGGSLADVAEQVGITQAGVLHYFGSKDQLLLDVLVYRDAADVEHLEGRHIPGGLDLFRHLAKTAALNAERPGIVQAYAVLSAESVTDGHPAKDWFRARYTQLRSEVEQALTEVCAGDDPPHREAIDDAAAVVLAVMDGLQIQWLLDPEAVNLPRSTAFAIEAILAHAVDGHARAVLAAD